MAANQKYVTRLMRARCTCGTIDNYLNVDRDHGVLVGADSQPLMNANDHTDKHVIHFGKCNSDLNPERMFRKKLVGTLLGGPLLGGMVADFLEDAGIMTCNCTPNTPNPWMFTNEDNIVEGAPALLFSSILTCRYGGCISLVPEEEFPAEETAQTDSKETDVPPEAPVYADACADAQSAIDNAVKKIEATGTAGEENVKNV